MDRVKILGLTVEELKAALTELKLSTVGRKPTLQDRLLEFYGLYVEEEEDKFQDTLDIEEKSAANIENKEEEEEEDNKSAYSLVYQQSHFTLKDIQDSISYFSGTGRLSVEQWLQEFEDNSAIVQWNELQKFLYGKQLLKGAAKLFIRSQHINGWEQLKTALVKEFGSSISMAEAHKILTKKHKRMNQSCLEFLYEILEIANPIKMDDNSIISYFVEGLNDHSYNKNMLYEAQNIDELKQKIKLYEKINANTRYATANNENSNKFQKNSFTPKKCIHCPHLSNHTTDNCKKINKICFKCNERGHLAINCKKQSETSEDSNNKRSQYKPNFSNTRDNNYNTRNTHDNNMHNNNNNRNNNYRTNDTNYELQTNLCNAAIRIYKTIQIANKKFTAILDTGSDVCLITKSVYDSFDNLYLFPEKIIIGGIGQGKMMTLGHIVIPIQIDDITVKWTFHVVNDSDIMNQSIIGNDILEVLDINITNNGATFKLKKQQKSLEDIMFDKLLGTETIKVEEPFTASTVFESICLEGIFALEEDDRDQLSPNNKSDLSNLIHSYNPCKVKESPVKMQITLTEEIPIFERPRKISISDQKIVEEQIEDWLKEGIVRVSHSEFAAAIVLVTKKDGTKRLCCDYRRINAKIIKDNFPMVLIDDVITKLQSAKTFTTLDLKNGFFHVPVAENSKKYTSFVTHHGQFEFNQAPFGMKNSPAWFCRFIACIFYDLMRRGILIVYMDDIIIPSQTEDENLKKLSEVLEVGSQYGLQINWKKCQFLKREITYLGYIVKDSTIKPSSEKTKAIKNYKMPTNVKSLQRFLGLTSYFRKFIDGYALIAKPLTSLLAKDAKFCIKQEHKIAFEQLKQALINPPVLKIYNPNAETEVHTDASILGYGAVLMQKASDDQNFHPVEYMSRQTSKAEQNYSSYELEVLAIVKALEKWRIFLLGINFKVITDCIAFTQTVKKPKVPARVERWIIFLQDFQGFKTEHRAGSRLKHVDALSRVHCLLTRGSLQHSIIKAQKEEDWTSIIRKLLENECYKDFYLKNDMLYKDSSKEQIVVPTVMEKEIIEMAHNQGHFGTKKTIEIVEKNFYIKNVTKKVEKFVQNCIKCILVNQKSGKKEGLLNPIDKSDKPLHTFHIDHVGPMETTKKQYNYILTIVDAFSKFTWIFPTKSTTTQEVLNKLEIISGTFGNPERIITDRGAAFTSNAFKEFCDNNFIAHHLITTGVPKGNGQVERIHKIIISILAKVCVENKQNWYKHTTKIQQFINNTPSRSTKLAPFTILTGLDMKIPENVNFKNIINEEILRELQESRDEMRIMARENIQKIQMENKKYYDKNRKVETDYEIDELVAIKRTQFGTGLKIKRKYLGPYKIINKKSMGRYEVEKVGESEGPIKTTTTAEFMKKWQNSGRILSQDGRM